MDSSSSATTSRSFVPGMSARPPRRGTDRYRTKSSSSSSSSHPWRSDLTGRSSRRRSSSSSSSTASRSAWKLRMKERKLVFDSPVITLQEETDEEDEQQQQQQQHDQTFTSERSVEVVLGDDDAVSDVTRKGPPLGAPQPKDSDSVRRSRHRQRQGQIQLEDLLEGDEHAEDEDEDEGTVSSASRHSVASDSGTIVSTSADILPAPRPQFRRSSSIADLRSSLRDELVRSLPQYVHTADYDVVESVGEGRGRQAKRQTAAEHPCKPRMDEVVRELKAAYELCKTLEQDEEDRFRDYEYQSIMPEPKPTTNNTSSPVKVSAKINLKDDPSMQAFERMLAGREGITIIRSEDNDDDDQQEDETEDSTNTHSEHEPLEEDDDDDDDDDDYSEYSVDTMNTEQRGQRAMEEVTRSMLTQSRLFSDTFVPDEIPDFRPPRDEDEYSEYTIDEQTIADEETIIEVVDDDNVDEETIIEEIIDEETVIEEQTVVDEELTVVSDMGNTFATPVFAAASRRPSSDEQTEYEEVTVAGPTSEAPLDDDEYSEYTMEETVADDEQQRKQHDELVARQVRAEFQKSRMFAPDEDVFDIKTVSQASASSVPDDDELTYYEEVTVAGSEYPSSQQIEEPNYPTISFKRASHEEEAATTVTTTASDDSSASGFVGAQSPSSSSSSLPTAPDTPSRAADYLRQDIWSADSTVVWNALSALKEEATSHAPDIVRFGGLLAIVRAMEVHRANPQVQITACEVLERLSDADRETRRAMAHVGGLQAVVRAIDEHMEDADVQRVACRTLAGIMGDFEDDKRASTPVPKLAVEVVLDSLASHESDAAIQSAAFFALVHLCLDCPERLQLLSDLNGLSSMTVALQQPWKEESEKHEAISRFSMLLRQLAMNGGS